MAIHKGTELNNVNETWNQNERLRQSGAAADDASAPTAGVPKDLEQTIKEEAAEYDSANKEERVLDGDRATVRGDRSSDD